jgi:SAM-dependent methyltransferase
MEDLVTAVAPPGAEPAQEASRCRFCGLPLHATFVDLGMSPLANSYRRPEDLGRAEMFYPLRALICDGCLLVQLEEFESREDIFTDYLYFSSYSDTFLRHAREYVESAVARYGLGPGSHVVEIASNDGYLLQYLVERGIPVTGIEPAENVAEVARAKGVPTVVGFFGEAMARDMVARGQAADLVIGNNVLAHVPDLNDFVRGIRLLLAPGGTATLEFPHLQRLMAGNQFDTIYHEHFSYFSFHSVRQVFAHHGLTIHDVEEIAPHGGSLRIHARHTAEVAERPVSARVVDLDRRETEAALHRMEGYREFPERVRRAKRRLLTFLIEAAEAGKTVAAYGAPAKATTLLNYAGARSDLIDYTVDRSPHKQGLFLPGTRIPIHAPERIRETRPDYLLLLAWNLRDEVVEQTRYIREWGGRHVVPIPELEVL